MSFTHVCITLCHARIIYIHSTSVVMSRSCTHLGIYDHPLANDTYCEALDMTYQCVENEVLKTLTSKNSTIVMAASKQCLADYLLKSPANGQNHHLVGSSLEVVIDKFSTHASPNCVFHRPDKVNYSIHRPNSRASRQRIEKLLSSTTHGIAVLEIDCLVSKWHSARLPPNSAKRCWALQAIIGTMCNAKVGFGKHDTPASIYKELKKEFCCPNNGEYEFGFALTTSSDV